MVKVQWEQLFALLAPVAQRLGCELYDLEARLGGGGRGLLRLFIDKDGGVTLEDCEQVSRQVSSLLDVEDAIPGDYTLEVSSPGLDRRLSRPEHFDRFAGQPVRLKLKKVIDGQKRLRGTLLERQDSQIIVADGDARYTIQIADIDVARLEPQF